MKREHLLVVIAAFFYGSVIVGGEFFLRSGFSLFETALYPILFMTLSVLPVVIFKPRYLIPTEKILFFTVYGLIGAFAEFGQFVGLIFHVPVAVVALVLYTQPVWTLLLGAALLGEHVTTRKAASAALAFTGAAVLLFGSWAGGELYPLFGFIASLCGSVFVSLWVIWGRKSSIGEHHFITTTFGWGGFTSLWLLVMWPVLNRLVSDPTITRLSANFSIRYWVYLLLFAIAGGIVPSFCFFKGLRIIDASVAGIILLLEPVSAALLAALIFGQSLSATTVAGGALILLSNYLVVGATAHETSAAADDPQGDTYVKERHDP
jgi:drug/metabolite transporter (DMT)-like permease